MGILSSFLNSIRARFGSAYYGYGARSAPWNREIYEQETVRAIIDAIATHAAKGMAQHVIMDQDGRITKINRRSPYTKLLNMQANPIHSGFDLKYKLIAQMETRGTAICYIEWEGTRPVAMIPINYGSYEIREIIGGGYAIQFDDNGQLTTLRLEDVVVLKKMLCERDAAGDDIEPIRNTLSMIKASDEGFIEALNVSNKVRGIYKTKKTMLDPEDVKDGQKEFSERMQAAAKEGGIVGLDSVEDYVPLNVTPYSANAAQMQAVRENLFTYWRTPACIVKSDYTEQQGMAFYESKIEPIWEMAGEAFTNACFTQREKDNGNRIIFTGGALMGSSITTRINVIREAKETGLLLINEQRELLGYPPVEGGDIRQVSLNYVNADKQDKYQTGEEDDPEETVENNDTGGDPNE
ncbi:phage portal protein, HK97 family [Eubacterium aggregans]|uniref:Phage portal protein, HK97 family n=1 Tax=Eubacterium aggregans TaxID=81409 RepID=A0A1H4BNH5_9FIRM|nr:phage portal protein [Eubacterium aggregans]SEA49679.1 phage portal protein, HK97 family [Eubacterium aggregans]